MPAGKISVAGFGGVAPQLIGTTLISIEREGKERDPGVTFRRPPAGYRSAVRTLSVDRAQVIACSRSDRTRARVRSAGPAMALLLSPAKQLVAPAAYSAGFDSS